MSSSAADRPLHPPSPLSRVPSPALVLGGIASVQFGAAIATSLFARVGPGGAVFLRLVSATVLLLAVSRPRVRAQGLPALGVAAALGLALAGMNITFYQALDRIPLGIAVTVEFVGPLSVAIVGSRRPRDLVWVALAALGIAALVHGGGSGVDLLGLGLALVAGGFWAGYILLTARVGRRFDSGTGLALAMIVATLCATPIGLVQGGADLLSAPTLAAGCAVGLLSSAIPYSLEMEALRRIPASLFGVLMSLEPGVATLAGFAVLGQSLSARELAGVLLVVCASLGATLAGRRTAPAG